MNHKTQSDIPIIASGIVRKAVLKGMGYCLSAAIITCSSAVCLAQVNDAATPEPLLSYKLNEGAGTTARDSGSMGVDLSIGPGLAWSNDSSGEILKISIRDGTAHAKNFNRTKLAGLDNLKSYTVTGWIKSELSNNSGRILSLPSREAGQFTIYLYNGSLIVEGANGDAVGGIPIKSANRWIFFAATVDTTIESNNVKFYIGSENDLPMVTKEATISKKVDNFVLGKVQQVILFNSHGYNEKSTLAPETALKNVELYGSASGSSGALPESAIDAIRKKG